MCHPCVMLFLVFLAHKCWVRSEVCRGPNWTLWVARVVLFLYSTNLQIITIHGVLLVLIISYSAYLLWSVTITFEPDSVEVSCGSCSLLRQNSAAGCSKLQLSFKLYKPNISSLSGQQSYAKTFLQHRIWTVSSLPQSWSLMVYSWDSLLPLSTSTWTFGLGKVATSKQIYMNNAVLLMYSLLRPTPLK